MTQTNNTWIIVLIFPSVWVNVLYSKVYSTYYFYWLMCIILKISIIFSKIKIFCCISIEGGYVYRISDQQAGTELNCVCNAHVPCWSHASHHLEHIYPCLSVLTTNLIFAESNEYHALTNKFGGKRNGCATFHKESKASLLQKRGDRDWLWQDTRVFQNLARTGDVPVSRSHVRVWWACNRVWW